ncbi:hypothetical protein M1247_12375 [Mycobacterium sp. 21AC1]|uniref:hypothetical protein n=1 Tax=[Mycobacterium] appelbergii TaxID=2939269 RepID=UPI002938E090|nr:hypothetical protein [Mycobacterium sp. 21AC1]MDV3125714.1 hypothetical protein [Mycobacterium sp. 21AC1]
MTPEESKAQVVDAARDLAHTVGIDGMTASFQSESCNDQGEAPFRGSVHMSYPVAEDLQKAEAERAAMIGKLQAHGWSTDSEFRTHGAALHKDNVTAVVYPQNVTSQARIITIYGECRDVTTTKSGDAEDIALNE